MTRPSLTVVAEIAAHVAIGSDRVNISPTARLRFDELRGRVARISSTMLSQTATAASADQAEAMLLEIAEQARAAGLALKRGR